MSTLEISKARLVSLRKKELRGVNKVHVLFLSYTISEERTGGQGGIVSTVLLQGLVEQFGQSEVLVPELVGFPAIQRPV